MFYFQIRDALLGISQRDQAEVDFGEGRLSKEIDALREALVTTEWLKADKDIPFLSIDGIELNECFTDFSLKSKDNMTKYLSGGIDNKIQLYGVTAVKISHEDMIKHKSKSQLDGYMQEILEELSDDELR